MNGSLQSRQQLHILTYYTATGCNRIYMQSSAVILTWKLATSASERELAQNQTKFDAAALKITYLHPEIDYCENSGNKH